MYVHVTGHGFWSHHLWGWVTRLEWPGNIDIFQGGSCPKKYKIGLVVSNIFVIFPPIWGNDSIWRAYFSDGLVQPPTRKNVGICFLKTKNDIYECFRKSWVFPQIHPLKNRVFPLFSPSILGFFPLFFGNTHIFQGFLWAFLPRLSRSWRASEVKRFPRGKVRSRPSWSRWGRGTKKDRLALDLWVDFG